MNNEKANGSNYMEQTMEEMRKLFNDSGFGTIEEIQEAVEQLLAQKIKESFKNGIEVGQKRPAQRKQESRDSRQYRGRRYPRR